MKPIGMSEQETQSSQSLLSFCGRGSEKAAKMKRARNRPDKKAAGPIFFSHFVLVEKMASPSQDQCDHNVLKSALSALKKYTMFFRFLVVGFYFGAKLVLSLDLTKCF